MSRVPRTRRIVSRQAVVLILFAILSQGCQLFQNEFWVD